MNRRRLLRLLASAGALLAVSPGRVFGADTAHELALRGQDLLTAGQTAKALEVLLQAQALDPRDERVQALLGRAWFQQGDARQALEHFQIAVRLNPEDTLSRMMAETISQFPVPRPKSEPGREKPGARPSALEREALAERKILLDRGVLQRPKGPFRLLLDPGHGGADPGSAGQGLREADVTLDLALRLARVLAPSRESVEVFLTRTADVALPGWARAALAGFYGADALVSLHAARLGQPQASGVAVYAFGWEASGSLAAAVAKEENAAYGRETPFSGRGGDRFFAQAARQATSGGHWRAARELAQALAKALPSDLPLPRPLSRPDVGAAPIRLLAEADGPAILVEAGFLSHPGDAAVLAEAGKRQALAQGLAAAVLAMARFALEEKSFPEK